MKQTATLLCICISPFLFGQQTQNETNQTIQPLITITQAQPQGLERIQSNDEGTNNPVVTGSTEYIQGERKFYIKSNEMITIIFEEKQP